MEREKFIRQLRKEAKAEGLRFEIDRKLGKGSHYRLRVGNRLATVKSGDLSPVYMRMVRKQLGLL